MWDPAQYAEQLRPHQGLGSLSTTRKVNNGSIKFSAPERRKTGLSHKQNNFFFLFKEIFHWTANSQQSELILIQLSLSLKINVQIKNYQCFNAEKKHVLMFYRENKQTKNPQQNQSYKTFGQVEENVYAVFNFSNLGHFRGFQVLILQAFIFTK